MPDSCFKLKCKEEVRQHIEEEVPPVLMDQSACENRIDPLPPANAVGMKHKLAVQAGIRKRVEARNDGENKNDAGHRSHLKILQHKAGKLQKNIFLR